MASPQRVRILGCPVDVVDIDQAAAALADFAAAEPNGHPKLAITLNPEMVMRAQREPDFAAIANDAALLTPDGIGLVRAIRRRGVAAERVTGVDLVEHYLPLAVSRGQRVALVGGYRGVAKEAAAIYRRRFPGLQIAIADSGDPTLETARRVAASAPNIVLAAYGPGKQERFLRDFLTTTGAGVGIGVGGTFDIVAGRVRRAPKPVRRIGMEWAWRLMLQPWRIRRQLVLPRFWLRERREARQIARVRG